MTGTLGLFSLVDLFQLLASSSRTGRLRVDHPLAAARVYFDKGRVVHADFGDFRGEEAVFALFGDERGSFEFKLGLPPPETSVSLSTENLLLEAIRRLDESRRNTPTPSSGLADEAIPTFVDATTDTGRLTLQGSEQDILNLIDGHRDLARIAESVGLSLEATKWVVSRLLQIGVIKVRSKKPRIARLITGLSRTPLPSGTAALDASILDNWARVLGGPPTRIACRRPDGQVDIFAATPSEGAGPHILFSRETLFAANLGANTTLLVKPLEPPL